MNEERSKLNYLINEVGIKAKKISEKTGILQSDLSRYKNGKIILGNEDLIKLKAYLDTFNFLY